MFQGLKSETADAETEKTKYHHVKAKGINLRVDQKLVDEINRENTFERSGHLTPRLCPLRVSKGYNVPWRLSTSIELSGCRNMPTSTP
jgi:hypothetical protein